MAEREDIDRKHTHWSVDNTWCVRVNCDSVFREVKRFIVIIISTTALSFIYEAFEGRFRDTTRTRYLCQCPYRELRSRIWTKVSKT